MFNTLGFIKCVVDETKHYYHSTSLISAVPWYFLHSVQNKSISSSIQKFSSYKRDELEQLSKRVELKYILGVVNSTYAKTLLTNIRGGGINIYANFLREIPIPIVSDAQQASIISLVDKILAAKKADQHADTSVWEAEIDRLVYDLYGVPEGERK